MKERYDEIAEVYDILKDEAREAAELEQWWEDSYQEWLDNWEDQKLRETGEL